MVAESIYILCSMTSTLCAAMLYRKYGKSGFRLLLWSSLCFAGLAVNNILLFVDKILFANGPDLSVIRTLPAVLGVCVLIYGFVWESV
jgi:hypothetical protein